MNGKIDLMRNCVDEIFIIIITIQRKMWLYLKENNKPREYFRTGLTTHCYRLYEWKG